MGTHALVLVKFHSPKNTINAIESFVYYSVADCLARDIQVSDDYLVINLGSCQQPSELSTSAWRVNFHGEYLRRNQCHILQTTQIRVRTYRKEMDLGCTIVLELI